MNQKTGKWVGYKPTKSIPKTGLVAKCKSYLIENKVRRITSAELQRALKEDRRKISTAVLALRRQGILTTKDKGQGATKLWEVAQ